MNLYRLSLDRSRKQGPRHTVIRSSEVADGSCMSPKRWLGGECEEYPTCPLAGDSCKAEPTPDLCEECGNTLYGDEETLCSSCEEYARKAKP